ncbi:uncharacterized protein LOC129805177 [Phlebotomus papatasi]|uniref:uncharacterized protein LOC129805177 n=1 Tax=Phlebotomus papatasi TaxID=29031 RepID=UPI00248349BA|nr:uncharacterized protein LOC129805177 [Phlebotomus papatasi]
MGKIGVVLIFICILATIVSCEKARFDNYRVFTVGVDSEDQLKVLRELESVSSSSYDFWTSPTKIGRSVDIMVPPHKSAEFEEVMTTYQFATTLKVENVQELIDNEQPKFRARDGEFGWTQYHTLEEIYAWLDLMLEQYSTVLTPIDAGNSFEGLPIRGVLLSYREGNPAVFIESNTHAREWITSATATYVLNEFLTSTDPDIRRIAESYDWYIFPNVNPDGFRFSHENNRMWRKTRSRHGLVCRGVDPNRNWAHQWQDGSGPGASSDVCSETYAGPQGFSEPETRQLADFILDHVNHIKVFLSFHSYSQLLLYPWSYTAERADNYDDLHQIGVVTGDKLKELYDTEYTIQSSYELYISTGTSVDWTYGQAGIRIGYTYEFRDTGRYGFILPADQIIPNAVEVLQSMIAMLDECENLGYMTQINRMKFVILGILIAFVVADPARFDNYRVYSVSVESEDNLKVLRSVNRGLNGYDFLVEPRILGDTADIIVPPHLQNDFEQLAKKHELKVELVIPDLQRMIDMERPIENIQKASEDFDVNEYHSTEHINEWLYYLAEQYPEVQIIRGGSTFEGRDIIGININRRGDDSPGIFIESNIHAREWITSASTVWMINKLLTATDTEPEYKDLADNINWYIFPVVNVDGYEYSRDVYRMWRKTRSRQGFICHGVDPNRNWDTYWQTGGTGASDNMCDGDFGGPEAFSEIETETLSDYILSIQDKLNIYISFHSAAELLLFPWGHTSDPVPGFEDFNTIAQTTVDALRERHGTQYRFGSINQAIYPATGGSIDWVFLRLGILSYCYEFRSRNTATGERYGFLAPPDQIQPNAEEVLDSMVAMVAKARELGHL